LAIDFLIDFHGKLNQLEILKKIQNQYLCYLIDYNQYSMLRVVEMIAKQHRGDRRDFHLHHSVAFGR